MSRRDVLRNLVGAGVVMAGASTLLAACGGSSEAPQAPAADAAAPAAEATAVNSSTCPGYAELTEQDRATRTQLQYVDASPQADRHCNNCMLYVEPANGSACGGCTAFAGPVAPLGWCMVWAPKMG